MCVCVGGGGGGGGKIYNNITARDDWIHTLRTQLSTLDIYNAHCMD